MKVMKEEFAAVVEAMRRAQAELAGYLGSHDHNAELTIAKLVGILDRREVVSALRRLGGMDGAKTSTRPGAGRRKNVKTRALMRPVSDTRAPEGPAVAKLSA